MMEPTPRQIGMRLKRLRRARKLSKYALAKQAGISAAYVAKLEAGAFGPDRGDAAEARQSPRRAGDGAAGVGDP